MCLKEFCCWTPQVEGEGSMGHRPHHEASSDPPKKTLGANDSDVKAPPASPLKGNSNGGHSKSPKETPDVSNSIGKVLTDVPTAPKATTDGDQRKAYTGTQKTTSKDVHPSTSEESLPKEATAMKKSSANVTKQQPATKIEHENIASTGEFTGQTRRTVLHTAEMKGTEVDKKSL